MNTKESVDAATEQVQTVSIEFFVSIIAVYMCVCLTWLLARKLIKTEQWPEEEDPYTDRKWIDVLMVVAVAAGVLALGQVYRAGWLLPDFHGKWKYLSGCINLSIPFLPIFLCLIVRRQATNTIWMTTNAIGWKLIVGTAAAIVGMLVFYVARWDFTALPGVVGKSFSLHSLSHAPAVFLEAVAIAFVFVRLKWVAGTIAAIFIPSVLFAIAHVPSGIEAGRSVPELLAFFALNVFLPAAIFATVARSRDIIWIAIPHYFLDVAIGAIK